MTSNTYISTVSALNSALITAGISTLSFTYRADITIGSTLYPNAIDYIGYILDSSNLKVQSLIVQELGKVGEWTIVKSPGRVVTPPVPPSGDHFITLNGYYVSSTDLPAADVLDVKFRNSVEDLVKSLSIGIQNQSKQVGYTTVSQVSTATFSDPTITGDRTIVATATVVINKAP
jgi:hypothetical protein